MAESPKPSDPTPRPNSFEGPAYFTDEEGQVARMYTTDEFSSDTKTEIYDAERRSWVYEPRVGLDIWYGDAWVPCSKEEGEDIAVER